MAYTTASALLDAVRQETDWSGADDTTMLRLLNRAFWRIEREHDFTWQEEVVTATLATAASGFSRFAQPTDAKELKSLYVVQSSARTELTFSSYYDSMAEFGDATLSGTAETWSLFRDEIYVFPRLNSAITGELYYLKFLAEFTATSSNNFLIYGADALIYALKREYYELSGETAKAASQQGYLADAVTSLLRYHRATTERPRPGAIMRTPGTTTGIARGGRVRMFLNERW